MTAKEKICEVLAEVGIDYVFGLPGGGTIQLFDALFDWKDKIKTILVRHEQCASVMADIYGRITGKPGVLIAQGPWVGSNGMFGIMEAFLSSSPMLVLTCASDYSSFSQHGVYQVVSGEYGSVDLRNILKSASKYVSYATTPEEAVQGTQLAIKHSLSGRPGPACVIMKTSIIGGKVDSTRIPKIFQTTGLVNTSKPSSNIKEIENAVDFILKSEKPILILGNGIHVSKAYNEVKEFAEMLSIPLATSYKGKSTISELHPLSVGMMGGWGGSEIANKLIGEADLLIVVGCRLMPNDTKFENPNFIKPEKQKIIQIDIDERNAGWIYPLEKGLIGDAKCILEDMLKILKGKNLDNDVFKKRKESIRIIKENDSTFKSKSLTSSAIPILPQRLINDLNKSIPPESIVTFDAGANRVWACKYLQAKETGKIFVPGGTAGMGWGPTAAVCAKIINPQVPVFSISGDGGFMMTLNVLSTAVQYNAPVIFIIMNNSVLGFIRDFQGKRIIGSEYVETDFAKIANGFGCNGICIQNPEDIVPTIEKVLTLKEPTVIDIKIDPNEKLWQILSM